MHDEKSIDGALFRFPALWEVPKHASLHLRRHIPLCGCRRRAVYLRPPKLIDRVSLTRPLPAALLAMRIASRKSHSLETNPLNRTWPFSTDTVTCPS